MVIGPPNEGKLWSVGPGYLGPNAMFERGSEHTMVGWHFGTAAFCATRHRPVTFEHDCEHYQAYRLPLQYLMKYTVYKASTLEYNTSIKSI